MEKKLCKINVGGVEYAFAVNLSVGAQASIAARRADLCNGYYSQMIKSEDDGEFLAAANIRKICDFDARIVNPPEGFAGFANVDQETLDALWKEWTEKSGLFRVANGESNSGTSGSEDGDGGGS
jgi:hypothetical protein